MEQQIVAYGKEIDSLERQEKLAREMNAATSVPLVSAPGTHTEQTEKSGIAYDSYSNAFWNNIRIAITLMSAMTYISALILRADIFKSVI